MNKKQSYEKYLIWIMLAGVFIYYTIWAVIQPMGVSPDEPMRFDVISYMVEYMKIPDGRAPEIRNPIWGISYAYFPMLPYMLMAIPAKIVSLFTDSTFALVIASRMVNVCSGTAFAWFIWKISEKLFKKNFRYLFWTLTVFLPGAVFLHSYINTDSMALMGSAWIVYVWVQVMEDSWDLKKCIQMGLAISICTLSYYNSYGFILCSIIFFISTMICMRKEKFDVKFFFKEGLIIAAIVIGLTAWWFVRNYILYDGDFLGMNITDVYAEKYARADLKPSVRRTPQNMGMSVLDMMLWQPGEMPHNWVGMVIVSFIGTFGHLNIFMPEGLSKVYIIIFAIGGIGAISIMWNTIFKKGTYVKKTKEKKDNNRMYIIYEYDLSIKKRSIRVFRVCMILSIIIPLLLAVRYSYASDFQPQGRYIMPILVPFMYFITAGYEKLLSETVKNEKITNLVSAVLSAALVIMSIWTYINVFVPNYM